MKPWTIILLSSWMALILMSLNPLGKIEGYFSPVVHNFEIEKVVKVHNGLELYGNFDKSRNCSFVGVEAYLKSNDQRSAVDVEFRDNEVIRTRGKQDFGPWFVRLQPEQLKNFKLMSVHSCHLIFNTVSKMF